MLASQYRFHGHGSLRYVYSRGTATRNRLFVCKSTENKRRSEPRVAVVISKKVVKSAVKRNRVRRRLYEVIRDELPNVHSQRDIVVIVVSPEILLLTHTQLIGLLQGCFTQNDLYRSA